jgi:hypothetical protein
MVFNATFNNTDTDILFTNPDKYPNFQFLSNELKFIWLLITEDRLIMSSSVAKLLVKLFEKRYTLLNGGVASLSS